MNTVDPSDEKDAARGALERKAGKDARSVVGDVEAFPDFFASRGGDEATGAHFRYMKFYGCYEPECSEYAIACGGKPGTVGPTMRSIKDKLFEYADHLNENGDESWRILLDFGRVSQIIEMEEFFDWAGRIGDLQRARDAAFAETTRIYLPMSKTEFIERFNEFFSGRDGEDTIFDWTYLRSKLGTDFFVRFDFENHSGYDAEDQEKLLGFCELPHDLQVFGFWAGGDWENPVHVIIYHDGEKIRCYFPVNGNLWNLNTRYAYGNDREEDLKDHQRRWGGYEDADPEDFEGDNDRIDIAAMRAEIIANFKPRTIAPMV
jgi:hypothetical protein